MKYNTPFGEVNTGSSLTAWDQTCLVRDLHDQANRYAAHGWKWDLQKEVDEWCLDMGLPTASAVATATQSQPVQAKVRVNTWYGADGSVWVETSKPPQPKPRLVEVQEGGKRFYRMVTS